MDSRRTILFAISSYLVLASFLLLAGAVRIDDTSENNIDTEGRIKVAEPFKSLINTGVRFMLAQSKLSNYVGLDAAMDIVSNVGYLLSKPSVLIKTIGVAAVTIISILTATLISPKFYTLLETAYVDPDRYLSNGLSERTVFNVIDGTCKQKALCYFGEILKCSFPDSSESLTRWTSDNFPSVRGSENKYMKAFTSGFVDRNCTKLMGDTSENGNCLGSFINNLQKKEDKIGRSKEKYQNIQPVARA